MSYDLGDQWSGTVYTYNDAGALTNATTVALTITLPDGTTTSPSVTNSATGTYTASYTPTMVGRHTLDWTATGTVVASYEDAFLVTNFYGLVSLADAQAHLNITSSDYDDELIVFIDRATDLLEAYTGRALARRTYTSETYSGEGASMLPLRHAPVTSITSVTESGSSVSASGYSLDGDAGILWRLGGTYYPGYWVEGIRNITVTYVAGYANPPGRSVQACLELVRHLWETQRGTFAPARAGASTDDYVPGLSFSMPRRVAELVDDLRVPGVA